MLKINIHNEIYHLFYLIFWWFRINFTLFLYVSKPFERIFLRWRKLLKFAKELWIWSFYEHKKKPFRLSKYNLVEYIRQILHANHMLKKVKPLKVIIYSNPVIKTCNSYIESNKVLLLIFLKKLDYMIYPILHRQKIEVSLYCLSVY